MDWLDVISAMSDITSVSSGIIMIAGAVLAHVSAKGISKEVMGEIKKGNLRAAEAALQKNEDMTNDQKYKMHNFVDVTERSVSYFSKAENTKDENKKHGNAYDIDWFMRFYDSVGHVSEDYLKDIWARLLAGEIAQPTSYSLRTIETLRTMSVQEARLFDFVCPHVIRSESGSTILPNYKSYREYFEIKYDDVLTLSEAGVIYMEGALKGELSLDQDGKVFYINDNKAISIKSINESVKKISIPEFPLTRVGKELHRLVDIKTTNESFLLFCNEINKTDGISAKVCDAEKLENGHYRLTI